MIPYYPLGLPGGERSEREFGETALSHHRRLPLHAGHFSHHETIEVVSRTLTRAIDCRCFDHQDRFSGRRTFSPTSAAMTLTTPSAEHADHLVETALEHDDRGGRGCTCASAIALPPAVGPAAAAS